MQPTPILIISASPRNGSQSSKVCAVIERLFSVLNRQNRFLDIAALNLPLAGVPTESPHEDLTTLQNECLNAAALVIVCPEWGGMATPSIKNALLLLTGAQIAHKPIMLVSVSSGLGGAYPIAELRAFSSKNSHALYVPHHVIVRYVESLWVTEEKSENDLAIENRLSTALQELIIYADALAPHIDQLKSLRQNYRNGM